MKTHYEQENIDRFIDLFPLVFLTASNLKSQSRTIFTIIKISAYVTALTAAPLTTIIKAPSGMFTGRGNTTIGREQASAIPLLLL